MSMKNEAGRPRVLALVVIVVAGLLTGCASTRNRAPVEVRIAPAKTPVTTPTGSASTGDGGGPQTAADKPGYYTVKPADTLVRIALDNGQNWKDLARWNGLDNPNLIEVGQVLRVAPPGADPAPSGARSVSAAKVDSRPLETRPAPAPAATVPGAMTAASANGTVNAAPAPAASTSAAATASAPLQVDDALTWMWPASGPVTTAFDEVKSKGLAIAGKAGDPVLAAADGRVVYAGSGLRSYGNLVIVKHNATYLTAYAHNQTLLVKEDQAVRRGQKIAEMGSTDTERVQLHFEIRKLGKPIDPAKLLPAR